MNIYKLTTKAEKDSYDYYDSAIVVASNEDDARAVHPLGNERIKLIDDAFHFVTSTGDAVTYICESMWASRPDMVDVEFIGVADSKYTKPAVICASFNAG